MDDAARAASETLDEAARKCGLFIYLDAFTIKNVRAMAGLWVAPHAADTWANTVLTDDLDGTQAGLDRSNLFSRSKRTQLVRVAQGDTHADE